jgi:hypothetical protein
VSVLLPSSEPDRDAAIGKGDDRTGRPFLDLDAEITEPGAKSGKVRLLVRAIVGRAELPLEDRAKGDRIAHRRLDDEVAGIDGGLVSHRTHVLIPGKGS